VQYWKLSLGKQQFTDELVEKMLVRHHVSVYPEKAQGENFLNAEKGDIFYVCRSNDAILLLGMFKDNLTIDPIRGPEDGWLDRRFVLLQDADTPQGYNNNFQRKWSPRFQSTFMEIEGESLPAFQREILRPVFNNISITDLIIKRNNAMEKIYIDKNIELLKYQKQIILQGPPGTGKTRLSKIIARSIVNSEQKPDIDDLSDQVKLIQFHPSFSYEDFVRGITATTVDGKVSYKTINKILVEMANKANEELELKGYYNKDSTERKKILDKTDTKKYILIIDEINRANLSSVLGELIYALEYRDETVESMYDLSEDTNKPDREIMLPSNLYIIGTMNTADRSVGHIDYAIRRRFTFIDVLPDKEIGNRNKESKFNQVNSLFVNEKNERSNMLSPEFNPDDVRLGHSYFIADNSIELNNKLQYQVIPLLKEYIKDGILIDNEDVKNIIKQLEKSDS